MTGFRRVQCRPVFSVDPASGGGARFIHHTSRSVSVDCAVGLGLFEHVWMTSAAIAVIAMNCRLCELAALSKHFAPCLADRLALGATLHPYPSNAPLDRDRTGSRVDGRDRARCALPAEGRLALKLTRYRRVGIAPQLQPCTSRADAHDLDDTCQGYLHRSARSAYGSLPHLSRPSVTSLPN